MSSLTKIIIAILIIVPLGFLLFRLLQPEIQILDKSFLLTGPPPSPKIPPKTLQTFILLGDTGTASQMQYDVAKAIQSYCQSKTCLAAFIAGDVIYDEGVKSNDDPQFATKFEEPYKNIDLPFYIAYGNHDYKGCTLCYLQYSDISTKWQMPSSYFTKQFEDIEFYVIDTENFNQRQQEWLSSELASSTASHKAVIGHRPLKTYEETNIDEKWQGRQNLKDIICSDVDVYISGHSHLLEFVGPVDNCKVAQIISGSGGSYPRKMIKENKSRFYFEDNGFATLTLGNNQLILDFVSSQGEIIKTTTIDN